VSSAEQGDRSEAERSPVDRADAWVLGRDFASIQLARRDEARRGKLVILRGKRRDVRGGDRYVQPRRDKDGAVRRGESTVPELQRDSDGHTATGGVAHQRGVIGADLTKKPCRARACGPALLPAPPESGSLPSNT
jgi:hypothetical protein